MNNIEVDWNNYESPVELISRELQKKFEENCVKVIENYGINVNADELVKALQYDRKQYEKGYTAGYLAGYNEGYDEGHDEGFDEGRLRGWQ